MMDLRSTVVVLGSIGIILLKNYNNSPACRTNTRIDGKVVIVTGPNTGIGKETVVDLAKRGGHVVMACRSVQRCRNTIMEIVRRENGAVSEDSLNIMKLDLSSMGNVRQFVKNFKRIYKRLDILINNAGVMCFNQNLTAEGFDYTFGVNHLGPFLLTNLLLDLLNASSPSRVVTVASEAHWHGVLNFHNFRTENDNCLSAYAQSKLANVLFSKELAKRMKGTGVTTYSLHPGAVMTDMGRNFQVNNFWASKYLISALLWPFCKDNYHGAQTTVCCALDPGLSGQTGQYYKDCSQTPSSSESADDLLSQRLWNVSAKLVNLEIKH